jgi:ribose 5-phosphate isomerase B
MVYLAADHGGFKLKEKIKNYFVLKNIKYKDEGNFVYEKDDDFPDFAYKAAINVAHKKGKAILICRNGVGVCIVANKISRVRAVLAYNEYVVRTARQDDNVNVLCLPGNFLKFEKVKKIINIFLKTKFTKKSRYIRRLNKIKAIEDEKFNIDN